MTAHVIRHRDVPIIGTDDSGRKVHLNLPERTSLIWAGEDPFILCLRTGSAIREPWLNGLASQLDLQDFAGKASHGSAG